MRKDLETKQVWKFVLMMNCACNFDIVYLDVVATIVLFNIGVLLTTRCSVISVALLFDCLPSWCTIDTPLLVLDIVRLHIIVEHHKCTCTSLFGCPPL